jgi:hypothetical protein
MSLVLHLDDPPAHAERTPARPARVGSSRSQGVSRSSALQSGQFSTRSSIQCPWVSQVRQDSSNRFESCCQAGQVGRHWRRTGCYSRMTRSRRRACRRGTGAPRLDRFRPAGPESRVGGDERRAGPGDRRCRPRPYQPEASQRRSPTESSLTLRVRVSGPRCGPARNSSGNRCHITNLRDS